MKKNVVRKRRSIRRLRKTSTTKRIVNKAVKKLKKTMGKPEVKYFNTVEI